jgi:HD superfamily phosphodiesterase
VGTFEGIVMTGRKTLKQIRDQIAAAQAAANSSSAEPAATLKSLETLAAEISQSAKRDNEFVLPAEVKKNFPGS